MSCSSSSGVSTWWEGKLHNLSGVLLERLESDKKQKWWTWLTGSLIVPFIAWTLVTFLFIFPFQLVNFAISKETKAWNLFPLEKLGAKARAVGCTSHTIFHFSWWYILVYQCVWVCLCLLVVPEEKGGVQYQVDIWPFLSVWAEQTQRPPHLSSPPVLFSSPGTVKAPAEKSMKKV